MLSCPARTYKYRISRSIPPHSARPLIDRTNDAIHYMRHAMQHSARHYYVLHTSSAHKQCHAQRARRPAPESLWQFFRSILTPYPEYTQYLWSRKIIHSVRAAYNSQRQPVFPEKSTRALNTSARTFKGGGGGMQNGCTKNHTK